MGNWPWALAFGPFAKLDTGLGTGLGTARGAVAFCPFAERIPHVATPCRSPSRAKTATSSSSTLCVSGAGSGPVQGDRSHRGACRSLQCCISKPCANGLSATVVQGWFVTYCCTRCSIHKQLYQSERIRGIAGNLQAVLSAAGSPLVLERSTRVSWVCMHLCLATSAVRTHWHIHRLPVKNVLCSPSKACLAGWQ